MSVGNAHHEFQVADDGIHLPFFATYSNAANRVADTRLTGPRVVPGDPGSAFRPLAAEDLFKFALQTDDNSMWLLLATTPTWQLMFSGGANRIDIFALKGSPGTLTRGQVVYASGWNDIAGVPETELARADSASTMPAVGVVLEDITDSVQGEVRVFGVVIDVDTSAFAQGDPLYISPSAAGEFVTPRPTGATDLVQFFGTALRIHATLGSHGAGGSLRAHSLPNLTKDKIWHGDLNNQPVETPFSPDGVLRNSKTGLVDTPNGLLSINVDTTKFDIKDSTGQIVDYSTPGAPTIVTLTWTGLTAVVVTNLLSASITLVYIEDTGGGVPGIVQTTSAGTGVDRRDKIFLGVLVHVGMTVIESVSNIPIPAYDVAGSLDDLILAFGDFNLSGNVYGPNGANLLADKSVGAVFGRVINAETNILNPNTKTTALQTGITVYVYSYRDGGGEFTTSVATAIDPTGYDDGTGVLATVGPNDWTAQRIYLDPRSEITIIEYGQATYNTKANAIDGVSQNAVVKNPALSPFVFRGWVVVDESATALNVLADAEFLEFRLETSHGSGPGPIATVDPQRFQVVSQELQFSANMEATLDFFLGAFIESIRVTVTEAAGTVTLNLDREGGGDLTIIFSDGYFAYDTTPADTVVLTAGSDILPTRNWIYVLQSTKTLTANTTGFPAAEHAPVADVFVQSASGVSTDGVYKLHAWVDHASANNGHLSHINAWIRGIPAQWVSGVDQTLTITPGAPDTVIFTTVAGIVRQLHPHDFPAFSGTPDIFVINDSVTAFNKIADLAVLLTDSLGVSMSGRYFSLVLIGVVSENAADSKLYLNLPSGSYNNQTGVEEDLDRFANFSIPDEFLGTGFLISELKLQHQVSGGGDWTSIDEIDLRPPPPRGGGGTAAATALPVFPFEAAKLIQATTADWAIGGDDFAPLAQDDVNTGLSHLLYDDTTETGAGHYIQIPATGSGNMQIETQVRALNSPAGAVVAKYRMYFREVTDNAATGSWGTAVDLTDVDIPSGNIFRQFDITDKTLAAWGLTVGLWYQFEVTRNAAHIDDDLLGDGGLRHIELRFTA